MGVMVRYHRLLARQCNYNLVIPVLIIVHYFSGNVVIMIIIS